MTTTHAMIFPSEIFRPRRRVVDGVIRVEVLAVMLSLSCNRQARSELLAFKMRICAIVTTIKMTNKATAMAVA